MTDKTKVVEALRICTGKDDSLSCTDCPYHEHYPGSCRYEVSSDAAAAIEALNKLVSLNTERCEGLRKQLREAQEQYEKNINELEKELSFSESTYEEFRIVAATQNALLAKQLPKQGEWVYLYDGNYKCSVCGEWYGVDETPLKSGMNYCPNCGAKMDGEWCRIVDDHIDEEQGRPEYCRLMEVQE